MEKIILIVVSFLVINNLFAQQKYKFCSVYISGSLSNAKIDTGAGKIILNSIFPAANNKANTIETFYFMQSKGWEFISVDHSYYYFRK